MIRGTRRADAAPSRFRWQPSIVAGSLFAVAIVVTSAVAAWPIYRSSSFVFLVVVASFLAAGISAAARVRRWSGWLVACVVLGTFLLVGIPLAVPSRAGSPAAWATGLGELTAGIAVAWKDLLTVDLPVGSYRNLLVPALVIFLAGTCAVLLLSWLDGRRAYLALPVALAMLSFGLFFGRSEVSAPLAIGPLEVHAPVETALGVASMITCLLWLSWRAYDERMHALKRAAVSSGVRVSRRATPADRRRAGLGVGMLALAVIAAVAIVPFAARGADRDVLRSAAGPDLELSRELSPLAQYRSFFADEAIDRVLFSYTAGDASPERVRIATLSDYDGSVFRVDAAEDRFVRVPSALDAGSGTPYELELQMGEWPELWMPTAGRLASAEFRGDRAAVLADGFYYSVDAAAGLAANGLAPGDSIRLVGAEPETSPLESLEAPGAVEGVVVPESVERWVAEHAEGTDGAALAGLVTLLRDRGYLSHGLRTDAEEDPAWTQELSDYEFQPSVSGHSLARMDALFSRLLERENDPRADSSGNYVAAVGDDEQFAVAVALIAQELGFPSRVVVGARLASDDPSVAVCADGLCRAQDLSAWTEVRSASGEWTPVDVTPQYAQSPSLEVTQQRDPEVVTEVRPDVVDEIVPPEPVQQDALVRDADDEQAATDLSWLWPALRVSAIVLLVLLLVVGPFIAIVVLKSVRRRSRREVGTPADRIAGGWDEYVDAAIDARRDIPAAATRTEFARALQAGSAEELALIADRAVFAADSGDVGPDDAAAYWTLVEAGRHAILRNDTAWRRLRAAVSLRSIIRPLAPASGTRTLFSERGRRRGLQPARPTT
ncbi:transglutaminase domain-containing protein [Microbacterium sp. SLBN-146]|uniref:transglutaminase domain-containing protein n=1 Tax=Microbacterium sp. SLBN-146 TaxID=2768457 RepID=UPI0011512645|nr:transglutaminase domain-containing protein [Microbacterium sp. SLBN-146]TQJ29760.1 transglutaminase superfamily protein [Microbacterium sp. SLBN-146]